MAYIFSEKTWTIFRMQCRPHSWHVWMTCMFSLMCLISVGDCSNPMLCRTAKPIARFKVPEVPVCKPPDLSVYHEPKPLDMQLFKPNLIQYRTQASQCKVITTAVTTYAGFFDNARTKTEKYVNEKVDLDTCRSMLNFHTSDYGMLTKTGQVYRTNNAVDYVYNAYFKCCQYYEYQTTNAYIIPTVVLKRHGSSVLESPIAVVKHCLYEQGHCLLSDKSYLTWSPDEKQQCDYLPHKIVPGKGLGLTWISDQQIALTFEHHRTELSQPDVCGGSVFLSDQGIATKHLRDKCDIQPESVNQSTSENRTVRVMVLYSDQN